MYSRYVFWMWRAGATRRIIAFMAFIQWNMRGLQANGEELSLLLSE